MCEGERERERGRGGGGGEIRRRGRERRECEEDGREIKMGQERESLEER